VEGTAPYWHEQAARQASRFSNGPTASPRPVASGGGTAIAQAARITNRISKSDAIEPLGGRIPFSIFPCSARPERSRRPRDLLQCGAWRRAHAVRRFWKTTSCSVTAAFATTWYGMWWGSLVLSRSALT